MVQTNVRGNPPAESARVLQPSMFSGGDLGAAEESKPLARPAEATESAPAEVPHIPGQLSTPELFMKRPEGQKYVSNKEGTGGKIVGKFVPTKAERTPARVAEPEAPGPNMVPAGTPLPGLKERQDANFTPFVHQPGPGAAPPKPSPANVRLQVAAKKGMGAAVSPTEAAVHLAGKTFTSVESYQHGEEHRSGFANIKKPSEGGTGTMADKVRDIGQDARKEILDSARSLAPVDHPANITLGRIGKQNFDNPLHQAQVVDRAHALAKHLGISPSHLTPGHMSEVIRSVERTGGERSFGAVQAQVERREANELEANRRQVAIQAPRLLGSDRASQESFLKVEKPPSPLVSAEPEATGPAPEVAAKELPKHLAGEQFTMPTSGRPRGYRSVSPGLGGTKFGKHNPSTEAEVRRQMSGRAEQMREAESIEPEQTDIAKVYTGEVSHIGGGALTQEYADKLDEQGALALAREQTRAARSRMAAAEAKGEDLGEALTSREGASAAPQGSVGSGRTGRGGKKVRAGSNMGLTSSQVAANRSVVADFLTENTEADIARRDRQKAVQGGIAAALNTAKNASAFARIELSARKAGAKRPAPAPEAVAPASRTEEMQTGIQKSGQERIAARESKDSYLTSLLLRDDVDEETRNAALKRLEGPSKKGADVGKMTGTPLMELATTSPVERKKAAIERVRAAGKKRTELPVAGTTAAVIKQDSQAGVPTKEGKGRNKRPNWRGANEPEPGITGSKMAPKKE